MEERDRVEERGQVEEAGGGGAGPGVGWDQDGPSRVLLLSGGQGLLPGSSPPWSSTRSGSVLGRGGARPALGGGFLRGAAPQGGGGPWRQHGDGRGPDREGPPGGTEALRRRAVGPGVGGAQAPAGSAGDRRGPARAA